MRSELRGLADGSIELIESRWIGGPNDGAEPKPLPFDFEGSVISVEFSDEPFVKDPDATPIDIGMLVIRRELMVP